ncbi:unnamed protein product [Paramecium sonneborni]|uniref:Uncharacterized protein n=1 Tax=Paramecium sonneborni TaxID=65129 RepID=A0A8S1RS98_9CILI|nr:unnamed protein product [Paramecium sonneborni]
MSQQTQFQDFQNYIERQLTTIKISNVEIKRNDKIKKLQKQYDNLLQQFEQFDCQKSKVLDQMNQIYKIENLVMDQEEKIIGLIIENEKLNQKIQEEMKIDQNIEFLYSEVQQNLLIYKNRFMKHFNIYLNMIWNLYQFILQIKTRKQTKNYRVMSKEKVIEIQKKFQFTEFYTKNHKQIYSKAIAANANKIMYKLNNRYNRMFYCIDYNYFILFSLYVQGQIKLEKILNKKQLVGKC